MSATHPCDSYHRLLSDLVAGELSEDKIVAVEEHLESCSDCRETLRSWLVQERAIFEIAAAGRTEFLRERIKQHLRASSHLGSRTPTSLTSSGGRPDSVAKGYRPESTHAAKAPMHSSRAWRWLALAAGLALALTGAWWFTRSSVELALRLTAVVGDVTVTRAGRDLPVNKGMDLHESDQMTVQDGGQASLKYDGEETRIELEGATTASFHTEHGGKRVRLDSGRLICSAAPQRKPLRIATPHGVAELCGTKFSLDVDGAATVLAVDEGRVALITADQRLEVAAGETALADASGLHRSPPETVVSMEKAPAGWLSASGDGESLVLRSATGPGHTPVLAIECHHDKDGWSWIAAPRPNFTDWRRFRAIRFGFRASNPAIVVVVHIRDNASGPGRPEDVCEYFEAPVPIHDAGWHEIEIPFEAFYRRHKQGKRAPDDGFNLTPIQGIGFVFSEATGRIEIGAIQVVH